MKRTPAQAAVARRIAIAQSRSSNDNAPRAGAVSPMTAACLEAAGFAQHAAY